MTDTDAAIAEIIDSPPALHWLDGEPQQWGLDPPVLRWLADNVQSDWRTLETGCGLSSVLLAVKAAHHTIVAPYDREHELVHQWCAERGFSTAHVRSVIEHSQTALPLLESEPLDLALIDGSHAFPMPFIDWYYVAALLRIGGYVIVDDTQLRPCRLLRDFLAAEEGRWRLHAEVATAVVFEKLDDVLIPDDDWFGQPWSKAGVDRPRGLATRLRAAIRV